ncbi:hypothetical protein ABIB94_007485 [Bradyrhizobium sp. JR7.2]|uniref:PQ loop repeat protein n=1 Tax=Bradyrhizobium barranii TaxID=2992140 RepID=A0ABY3R086_9BRAD|nr:MULTISPECIES: hypothetical protein [Bradyrhizobium]UFW91669.1 hypothetical protein BjapCC829_47820 [Bradyrhizobium japonicum]WFU00195.1 hypothetical protein QA633_48705 [Bradyrhizobium barranii]
MTLADYSFGAFAFLNTARLLGYFPQILRVHRDDSGAKAVSVFTWLLFSAANIATVSYAMIVSHDAAMAIIFALNTVGCLTIVGLTMWRRAGIRRTEADDGGAYDRLSGASSEKIPGRAKSRDRKLWRRRQIGWSLAYSAVLLVLVGVGYLLSGPKDLEIAQLSAPGQHAQIVRFGGRSEFARQLRTSVPCEPTFTHCYHATTVIVPTGSN